MRAGSIEVRTSDLVRTLRRFGQSGQEHQWLRVLPTLLGKDNLLRQLREIAEDPEGFGVPVQDVQHAIHIVEMAE